MGKQIRIGSIVCIAIAVALIVAISGGPGAGAIPPGGTTTTILIDDEPIPVPIDPTFQEFATKYPTKPAPAVVQLDVIWSAGKLTPAAESAQRTRVAQAQAQLTTFVNSVNASNPTAPPSIVATSQASIAPTFFAALNGPALTALSTHPLVKGISYDGLAAGTPHTEDSPPSPPPGARINYVDETASQRITGATSLHERDITGLGSTVAVIDTGIIKNAVIPINGTQGPTYRPFLNKVVAEKCLSRGYDPTDPKLCRVGGTPTYESTDPGAGEPCNPGVSTGANTWCFFHGSVVALDIAGGENFSDGNVAWSGLAPEANIISISGYHFTKDCVNGELPMGGGWCGGVSRSDLIRALDWIYGLRTTHRISSVNMSMGWFNLASSDADCGETPTSPDGALIADIESMFDLLRSNGIAPVASAGNWNNDQVPTVDATFHTRPRIYPSCIKSAVSAGGTTKLAGNGNVPRNTTNNVSWAPDTAWPYSQGSTGIDLLAPGPETSNAAANISAAFALARQVAPNASVEQIEGTLKAHGVPKYMPYAAPPVTKPRLQVDLAVNELAAGLGTVALPQVRIADTRVGLGARCPSGALAPASPDTTQRLKVTGIGGVPVGAKGVVLNLTVTNTSTYSFATVWGMSPSDPTFPGRPTSSTLNWTQGETAANSVTVIPDADGCVSIYNERGVAHFVVDVEGYLSADANAPGMTTMTIPSRVYDSVTTRSGRFEVPVAGVGGVPADATAVWVSVSANNSTSGSAVAVGPAPMTASYPDALVSSNLNIWSNRNFTNLALVRIGTGGKIAFHTSNGSARFVVDVLGYVSPASNQRVYMGRLMRFVDSRLPSGVQNAGPKITTAGSTYTIPPSVVPNGATAAIVNITTTQPTASTHVTTWATGGKPTVSQNQAVVGRDVPATVVVPLNGNTFRMAINSGQSDVVMDLIGFVR